MHSHQAPAFPISLWPFLQIVSDLWSGAAEKLRASFEAARQERAISELPPHLRHDMGDLDCHPPQPRQLFETLKSRQRTLETIWLSRPNA